LPPKEEAAGEEEQRGAEDRRRPGTDVMIFKNIFAEKFGEIIALVYDFENIFEKKLAK
jgi:hypothetical protein